MYKAVLMNITLELICEGFALFYFVCRCHSLRKNSTFHFSSYVELADSIFHFVEKVIFQGSVIQKELLGKSHFCHKLP